ncbi:MAG: hypothetical protein WBA38_04175 [Gordonia sp. (in: high G+C Gram-positive bacteria)]|uniref:hypothetical protein n=1 Tax=Gordonia sp. (in: high G+C Gram-positive bacteria) TaxID=84139 RepID=UPI003C748635
MSTDGFLTRAEVDYLGEKLGHIPDLEREMAIALTGGATPKPDGSRHGKPGSRPPYPLHIDAMLDELKAELVGAVRHVMDSRGIDYDSGDSLSGCSKWLIRYRFALSMMPDAGETFDGLCRVIDKARRVMAHEDRMEFTQAQVDEANKRAMTATGIATLAKRIGERGHGLNRQRVWRLVAAKKIEPIAVLDQEWLTGPDGKKVKPEARFLLGDVLDAHEKYPKRKSYGQRS